MTALAIGEYVNVDSWTDVAAIGLIIAGGWVTTWVTVRASQSRARKSHDSIDRKVVEVLNQTRNGHAEPLRSDIDRLIEGQTRQEQLLADTHRMVTGQGDDIRRLQSDVESLKRPPGARTRSTDKK